MKHIFYTVIFFSFTAFGQSSFQETFGGSAHDFGHSVEQTSDGGYIALGQTTSFGNGGQDLYLIKTDEFGVEMWSKTYGTADWEWGISVKQTSDDGYILCGGWGGTSNDSLVLIKTDAIGTEEWNYRFSGSMDRDVGQSVIETADGGFIAVGFTGGFPVEDVFIVKTSILGVVEWTKVYSGTAQEIARVVRQTSDLGYVVFGSQSSVASGERDYYLMRLDVNGDSLWTKNYGTILDEQGTSMHLNDDGSLVLIGYEYVTGGNIYVLKTDPSGNVEWDNYYGGSGWDIGYSIKETTDGGYVFSGRKDNTVGGGYHEMYCVKTDQFGTVSWEHTYPLGFSSDATSIQQTADGGYVMIGTTLDSVLLTNDVVLVKIPGSGILMLNESKLPEVSIMAYPNPFNAYTNISVDDPQMRGYKIRVFSSDGRLVLEDESPSGTDVKLSRSLFSSGLHHFEIAIANQIIGTGKLIIE